MRKIQIYCFCKNSVFLVTAVFFNFLFVAIGYWLKFEFSTIFRKCDCLVIFENWAVILQKRKGFCLKQFWKFSVKFVQKGIGLVLYLELEKFASKTILFFFFLLYYNEKNFGEF